MKQRQAMRTISELPWKTLVEVIVVTLTVQVSDYACRQAFGKIMTQSGEWSVTAGIVIVLCLYIMNYGRIRTLPWRKRMTGFILISSVIGFTSPLIQYVISHLAVLSGFN